MITDKELDTLDQWEKQGTPTMKILNGVVPRLKDEVRRLREENARLRHERGLHTPPVSIEEWGKGPLP